MAVGLPLVWLLHVGTDCNSLRGAIAARTTKYKTQQDKVLKFTSAAARPRKSSLRINAIIHFGRCAAVKVRLEKVLKFASAAARP